MAKRDINKIADYILFSMREAGECLTPLKLQKLLYYAQAWHLALYDKRLFEGKFEAWVHGPVNRQIYDRFKDYRWKPITEDIEEPKLLPKLKKYLDEVISVFGEETAISLEHMTHNEEPWREARGELLNDEPSNNEISEETMKIFYKKIAEKNN